MHKKMSFWKKIIKTINLSLVILFFFSISVYAICYASGYKINFRAKKIEKNGMIIVETTSENIEILINGKPLKYTKGRSGFFGPQNYVSDLFPGDYTLEIKNPGKKNYIENIKVEGEKITKIDNIVFLPKDIKTESLFTDEKINSYCLSQDGQKIIYKGESEKVFYYNLKNKILKQLDQKINNPDLNNCTWDRDDRRVVIKNNGTEISGFYILNSEDINSSFFLYDLLSFVPDFQTVFFSNDNDVLVGIANGSLHRIDIAKKEDEEVSKNIAGVLRKNDFIFYYENDKKNLYRLNQDSRSGELILEGFEQGNDFEIVLSNKKEIYIKNNTALYLITDKNNLELIDRDVSKIVKQKRESDNIFYNKQYELWSLNKSSKEKNIISRFSQEVDILEYFNPVYFVFSNEKEISLIKYNGQNYQEVFTPEKGVVDFRKLDNGDLLLIENKGLEYYIEIVNMEIIS